MNKYIKILQCFCLLVIIGIITTDMVNTEKAKVRHKVRHLESIQCTGIIDQIQCNEHINPSEYDYYIYVDENNYWRKDGVVKKNNSKLDFKKLMKQRWGVK